MLTSPVAAPPNRRKVDGAGNGVVVGARVVVSVVAGGAVDVTISRIKNIAFKCLNSNIYLMNSPSQAFMPLQSIAYGK